MARDDATDGPALAWPLGSIQPEGDSIENIHRNTQGMNEQFPSPSAQNVELE